MTTISVKEAEANLSELIRKLKPGDEVVITENDQPVARLISPAISPKRRKLGTLKGTVQYISPDFDAPLGDFREYTQ